MQLKDSTVLITGGTSGIGLELVKQLSGQSADIIITGRNLDGLNDVKNRFPNIHVFQSDVSKPDDIQQLYGTVTRQFPKLNILINNAGLMRQLDLANAKTDLENIACEVNTNLSGTIRMVHQFLPHLLKQQSAAIMNISSGIAFIPYSIAPVYSAAKAGVHAYTQALRLQLQRSGIEVFELIPPGVETNLHKDWELKPPENRLMQVEKVVRVTVSGMLKGKYEITPGLSGMIKVMSRIAPGFFLKVGHREFEKLKALSRQQ